jgi:hypothetical protein
MLKLSALVFMLATACFAQAVPIPTIEFSPKKYVCYKTSDSINVDGKMEESAWLKAEWTDDYVDIEGAVKPTPRFRTRCKMLWDENYLYIAAEIQEPDIWSNVKNRDDVIFYDNDFEVFIDPDGDTHRYSEFEMNALNTVWDLLLVQPYRDTKNAAIDAWDFKGLKTGVSVNGTINKPGDVDKNWTVEIAFPWKAFKEIAETAAPPNDNDQWRINFSRVEWKTEVIEGKYQKQIDPATGKPFPEDNWVWSPQGVVNMHYPEMWGYVQFSKEAVGSAKTSFIENKDEAAKWFLRNIYYKESSYFEKHGVFTTSVNELGIELKNIPGFIMPPVIECTTDMFEASLKSEDLTKKINIRTDGLTWISKIQK